MTDRVGKYLLSLSAACDLVSADGHSRIEMGFLCTNTFIRQRSIAAIHCT